MKRVTDIYCSRCYSGGTMSVRRNSVVL